MAGEATVFTREGNDRSRVEPDNFMSLGIWHITKHTDVGIIASQRFYHLFRISGFYDETSSEEQEYDERYDDAVALITKKRQASISMIQRHLRIGYNRAARIIEVMETEGVVGPSDGVKPREVLVAGYDDRE